MLSQLLRRSQAPSPELVTSKLFNESSFYDTFLKGLEKCHSEMIIECPFIVYRRVATLLPVMRKLKALRVRIVVNTRDPQEHDADRREDAHAALAYLQHIGVHLVYTAVHHRELAVLDRKILYEGSLNILSQNNSSEIMQSIESVGLAWQMVRFVELDRLIR